MSEKPEKPTRRLGQSRFALAAIGVILLAAFVLVYSVRNQAGSNLSHTLLIFYSMMLASVLWVLACILTIVAIIRGWLKKCGWSIILVAIMFCILLPLTSVGYFYWPTSEMLVRAASEGNASKVQWCINMGVDINRPQLTILGFNPASAPKPLSETPLTMAIRNQQFEIVKLLVKNGADVNQPDGLPFTPLKTAVYTANPNMVKLLLDLGADPSISQSSINLWVRKKLEPEIKTPETEAIKVNVMQIQEILEHAKASSTIQP